MSIQRKQEHGKMRKTNENQGYKCCTQSRKTNQYH